MRQKLSMDKSRVTQYHGRESCASRGRGVRDDSCGVAVHFHHEKSFCMARALRSKNCGMSKLIFLDIDGVLNKSCSPAEARRLWDKRAPHHAHEGESWHAHTHWFNESCVAAFNWMMGEIQPCDVVISSTWRLHGFGNVPFDADHFASELTRIAGLISLNIIGCTPHLSAGWGMSASRKEEIRTWLDANGGPGAWDFVVIDDDPDAWNQGAINFAQTSESTGLTKKIARKVVAYFA